MSSSFAIVLLDGEVLWISRICRQLLKRRQSDEVRVLNSIVDWILSALNVLSRSYYAKTKKTELNFYSPAMGERL